MADNIIRAGDTVLITAPSRISPAKLAEDLRKQYPGVAVSVISVDQEEIRVVAHYRPGRP